MHTLTLRVAIALAIVVAGRALASAASSPAEADAFLRQAEKELSDLSLLTNRAQWINATYINDDTDALAAEFGARNTELSVRLAKGAAKFDRTPGLSFDARRKLDFLKQGIVLPAPDRPGAAAELNVIATRLQSTYGKGKGTLDGKPINGSDIEEAMGRVRDPEKLK
jgi:peptidyl-dipeptidase A